MLCVLASLRAIKFQTSEGEMQPVILNKVKELRAHEQKFDLKSLSSLSAKGGSG